MKKLRIRPLEELGGMIVGSTFFLSFFGSQDPLWLPFFLFLVWAHIF